MSEAKPLGWSFLLTFPIVLIAIWGVLLALAHVERTQLKAVLRERIAHGSVQEARAALRQMVAMPQPPLDVFVVAATSPSRQVARQAQTSIAELLRKWQRQLRSGRHPGRVAHRLEELAAALDQQRDLFSPLDYDWLARTTEQLVRLANMAPPEDALGLAIHCESLLSLTGAARPRTPAEVVPVASTGVQLAPDNVYSLPSRLALQSLYPDDDADGEAEDVPSNDVDAPPSPPVFKATTPLGPLPWTPAKLDESTSVPPPQLLDRRHPTAEETASPIPVASSQRRREPADPWAKIDSRTLLARWLAANARVKPQVERELERRGFGSLRTDVVRLALSDDTYGRVQLVRDLPDTRGIGTKAWLVLLADDANADVRLAAVTVMATSNDVELIEKAWQVALKDQDPRIAGLVDQFRDRRDSQRR